MTAMSQEQKKTALEALTLESFLAYYISLSTGNSILAWLGSSDIEKQEAKFRSEPSFEYWKRNEIQRFIHRSGKYFNESQQLLLCQKLTHESFLAYYVAMDTGHFISQWLALSNEDKELAKKRANNQFEIWKQDELLFFEQHLANKSYEGIPIQLGQENTINNRQTTTINFANALQKVGLTIIECLLSYKLHDVDFVYLDHDFYFSLDYENFDNNGLISVELNQKMHTGGDILIEDWVIQKTNIDQFIEQIKEILIHS